MTKSLLGPRVTAAVYRAIDPNRLLGQVLILIRAYVQLANIVAARPSRDTWRFARLILKLVPQFTMVSIPQLRLLYDLTKKANSLMLRGAIVECGVWNGGSSALMAAADGQSLLAGQSPREMWLFDSFAGLPEPNDEDGERIRNAYFKGWCSASPLNVETIHRELGLPLERVHIVRGWFDATLPKTAIDIESIAILHIDADWYDSVKIVLDSFYDKVVEGGFVVLDDYRRWIGCEKAVSDFFEVRGLTAKIVMRPVGAGAYFEKPPN
jgi:hypothetical protein